ncbi:protein transport protein SEC23 G-like isoform X2 [Wolffia australiana]
MAATPSPSPTPASASTASPPSSSPPTAPSSTISPPDLVFPRCLPRLSCSSSTPAPPRKRWPRSKPRSSAPSPSSPIPASWASSPSIPWSPSTISPSPTAPASFSSPATAISPPTSITTAVEEMCCSSSVGVVGRRPARATGTAIAVAVALLEACSTVHGGRVMVFVSGPATIGPGKVAEPEFECPIRTHRDLVSGEAPLFAGARRFYATAAARLAAKSAALDLFACSLDQVGAAEMAPAVDASGGFMVLAESFSSEQFRSSSRRIFLRREDEDDCQQLCMDATLDVAASEEIKVSSVLGPCGSSGASWKLSSLGERTSVAFFFQVVGGGGGNCPVFFLQFRTRYTRLLGGVRLRVTTVARRWAPPDSGEVAAGFDQEAAAAVVARLAARRAEEARPGDVARWLDELLVRFTAQFGDFIPEDPDSFRLKPGFSLFPQFMFHLRRSPLLEVFNSSPDETAFFRVMLNRERVVEALVMVQPTLVQYSMDGPPIPVLLDVGSVATDVVLLLDSFFFVVVHRGAEVARHGPLAAVAEADAVALAAERVPAPRLVVCDQYSSQARFLLARLNPSATYKSAPGDGSGSVLLTDDISLQVFLEHLQELAVRS